MFRLFSFALAALLVACGAEPTASGPGNDSTGRKDEALGAASAVLHFDPNGVWLEGSLQANGRAQVVYNPVRLPSCQGTLNNGGPAWTLEGFYRLDGGEVKSFWAGGHSPTLQPPESTIDLGQGGELEIWFQVTNRWGCLAWDSDYGRNHRFQVTRPAAHPGWVGNVGVNISRSGGGCDAASPLGQGFTFGTWARSRAVESSVCFEVWKEGVTDWDNPNLWQELDVQIHHRNAPTAPFSHAYVNLWDRRDNNARYAFDVRQLDPFSPYTCPTAPFSISADGQYAQITSEFYFTVNGREIRPEGGATFSGEYSDYLSSVAHCQP